jgi:prepilin-type N-terminal cleavage/methylation domain-containing protein
LSNGRPFRHCERSEAIPDRHGFAYTKPRDDKIGEQGFTLIEQLFTIMILAITLTYILPVLTAGMIKIKAEDFQVRAASITQEMVEATRAAPFSELTDGTYSTGGSGPTGTSLAASFNDFKSKVTDNAFLPSGSGELIISHATAVTTSNEIREVKVTVNWMQGELDKSYDASTYIYNYSRE